MICSSFYRTDCWEWPKRIEVSSLQGRPPRPSWKDVVLIFPCSSAVEQWANVETYSDSFLRYYTHTHACTHTHQEICERFQPVFHHFFMEYFPSPSEWFEKRLAYTRSVAASSIGGWDRQTDMISISIVAIPNTDRLDFSNVYENSYYRKQLAWLRNSIP